MAPRQTIIVLLLSICVPSFAKCQTDINTVLMRSTFKVAGNGSTGTAFILGKPTTPAGPKAYYVMVSAAHVLKQTGG
jgi:hypothetical protein